MKKYWIPLLIFCLLLTGCSQGGLRTSFTSVQRQDVEISLNAPAGPILAALGAPFGYGESKSGVYAGVEKTYQFSGLRLKTFESQDGERIMGMMITDRAMQTPEGIAVGDTAAQVRSHFGENAIENNCCVISRRQEQMVLLLEHDIVTAIQYTLL